jgi:hypothetical protein
MLTIEEPLSDILENTDSLDFTFLEALSGSLGNEDLFTISAYAEGDRLIEQIKVILLFLAFLLDLLFVC